MGDEEMRKRLWDWCADKGIRGKDPREALWLGVKELVAKPVTVAWMGLRRPREDAAACRQAMLDVDRAWCWYPRMKILALAGVVAPIVFALLVIAQGLLQPDYSHVELPISALAAWPYGWIQRLNFYVLGLLMSAFVVGLHRGIRPTSSPTRDLLGPLFLLLGAAGIFLAGMFSWSRSGTGFVVPGAHIASALIAFPGAAIGLISISWRMSADSMWKSVAIYTRLTGIVMLVLFFAHGRYGVPVEAPLHPWAGLMQRITVAVWFTCVVVLAIRLLRVARGAEVASR
jgi:hypothetical membrane protein